MFDQVTRREIIAVRARGQSYVLRLPKYWPPPAPPHPASGGSIFWKAQDTALYSTYIEFSLRWPLLHLRLLNLSFRPSLLVLVLLSRKYLFSAPRSRYAELRKYQKFKLKELSASFFPFFSNHDFFSIKFLQVFDKIRSKNPEPEL